MNGDTIVKNFNFKTSDTSHSFCLGDSCSIRARAFIISVSSSGMNDGEITLEMLSGKTPFIYKWSNGESTSSITNLTSGIYSVLIQDSLNCTDSLFFEVGVGTSIRRSEEKSENIVVYPNPTKALITIDGLSETGEYNLEIRDIRGRLLIEEAYSSSSGKISLNINELENGIYLLTITRHTESKTIRIIKNN